MKKVLLIVALFIAFANSGFGQITWTKVDCGRNMNLNDIQFSENILNGFIAANGIILRTSDGGNKWDSMRVSPSNFQRIISVNSFNNVLVSDIESYFQNTSNFGATWQSITRNFEDVYSYSSGNFINFSFPISKTNGYSCFAYALDHNNPNSNGVFKTTDGGITWTRLIWSNNLYRKYKNLSFRNLNNGFVVGAEGNIIKTTDQGTTWIGPIYIETTNTLNGITYIDKNDNNIWILIGNNGLIYKTYDSGINWKNINSGVESNLVSIKFSDNKKIGIIVGEEGKILSSTDEGETWSVYTYPSQENLNAISIPPNQDKVAYIVGSNGLILKSVNITDVEDNIFSEKPGFSINPNPSSENISISINCELQGQSINIFNSLGFEIKTIEQSEFIGNSSVNMSTAELPSGMYYCTLYCNGTRTTKSFVVIK